MTGTEPLDQPETPELDSQASDISAPIGLPVRRRILIRYTNLTGDDTYGGVHG
jgi:hypothetical protein